MLIRKRGAQYKLSKDARLEMVRRYLYTDLTAPFLAAEASVDVSTFRRWVRQLPPELEEANPKGVGSDGEAQNDPEQGKLPMK